MRDTQQISLRCWRCVYILPHHAIFLVRRVDSKNLDPRSRINILMLYAVKGNFNTAQHAQVINRSFARHSSYIVSRVVWSPQETTVFPTSVIAVYQRSPCLHHSLTGPSIRGSTLIDFCVAWPWYHPWYSMASPRHPIPWCGIGFHGTRWGAPWHDTGGTMPNPAVTTTVLNTSSTRLGSVFRFESPP